MFGWLKSVLGFGRAVQDPEAIIPVDLPQIVGGLCSDGTFPRPQWSTIASAVSPLHAQFNPKRVWYEVQRQWLEQLVPILGDHYEIVETKSVLLLCRRYREDAESLARLCQNTLDVVESIVGRRHASPGKLPILVLFSPHVYYAYISHFYDEGEFGTSAGTCIREKSGETHLALVDSTAGLERTLAHEMVHACVKRGLPLWVEEGAAEIISRQVARVPAVMIDRREARRQKRFWSRRGLQGFWYGRSFHRPDKGQGYSYTMAEILVRNLMVDHRKQFSAFLSSAKRRDGGEAAALKHFGVSLGDVAEAFLGEGDWRPKPRRPRANPGVDQPPSA